MPASLQDRYAVLYKKFADSWRVTDKTSLFVYAPGTSTKTFTDRGWPAEELRHAAPAHAALTEVAKAAYPEGPYWRGGKLYYVEYSTDRAIMAWDGRTARPRASRAL